MKKSRPVSDSFQSPIPMRLLGAEVCAACKKYRLLRDAAGKPYFVCDHYGDIPSKYIKRETYDCPKYDPISGGAIYDFVC